MENRPEFIVGIDVSSEYFTCAAGQAKDKWKISLLPQDFDNKTSGFNKFSQWLQKAGIEKEKAVICMEKTGVYNELLVAFLCKQGYRVCVEDPIKVKKAFKPHGIKSDSVDSKQIAEYGWRFFDQLHYWKPLSETIEKVKTLLSVREDLVKANTADKNRLHTFRRKAYRVQLAEDILESNIAERDKEIKAIEKEIDNLIHQLPYLAQIFRNLQTIPRCKLLLAANLLVFFHEFDGEITYKKAAGRLGICPYEHSSGSSIKKRAKSFGHGTGTIRKLLHLAACSLCKYDPRYQQYMAEKLAFGKPKMVIYNNVANKLVKIIVRIYASNMQYNPNHQSVHPRFLTRS